MPVRHPPVSFTPEALVIRIPWGTVDLGGVGSSRRKRRLTADDVLELVEAGRLAHQLGKTRSVQSLKELMS